MNTKYTFVCEAANISQGGNLNVLGIFQNINSETFPVTFAKMIYVASIEFHRSEVGRHIFKVNFIDDDGKSVIPPLEGEFFVHEQNLSANLLLGIEGIVFPKAGTYAIDLTIDHQHMATDNIQMIKVRNQAPG
jgi:hypothetical protein